MVKSVVSVSFRALYVPFPRAAATVAEYIILPVGCGDPFLFAWLRVYVVIDGIYGSNRFPLPVVALTFVRR
jgi:hypothetical protein